MRPRYVCTGAAGFLGSHIAESLANEADVVIFDNLWHNSLQFTNLLDHPSVQFVKGDIHDRRLLTQIAESADAVFHLAAIVGVPNYYAEPDRTLRVNLEGTAAVVDAVVAAKVPKLVFVSTSEVYGSDAHDVDEESPCVIGPPSDRRWVYATSKLAGEHLVLRGSESHGFAATILRPFNIYGPRQLGGWVVSNFCTAGVTGVPLDVYGDGSTVRAYCYIDDFVSAAIRTLTTPLAAGQIFNIGNPDATIDTKGLAELIASMIPGARVQVQPHLRETAEVTYRRPVIEKARQILGFNPRIGLHEGLQRTIDWTRSIQESI